MADNFDHKKIEQQMRDMLAGLTAKQCDTRDVGIVTACAEGVITVSGLRAKMDECLMFTDGRQALVLSILSDTELIAAFIGHPRDVKAGETVIATGKPLEVPVGPGMLGRVVDAMGRPVDSQGPIGDVELASCKSGAPTICDRAPVTTPYHTGTKIVDLLIPIGRGQRELIIGDRNTGKTTIAIDSLLHQYQINSGVIGIYVAIGQRQSKVAHLVKLLTECGAMENCVVVLASSASPAIMQLLAPLTGCAIGQYFMNSGKHAVVIYDDLSKHAAAHRQLSLLRRKPPGREAYPGDVFYLHSSLLERGAQLKEELGGGSLTALPIIETQGGDITSYISTNVISITDGQIFLSTDLFNQGIRPAIKIGLSVSRIGSAAQSPIAKKIAGTMKLELAQHEELAEFAKFASEVDEVTQVKLDKMARIKALLTQRHRQPLSQELQCILFKANKLGAFDDMKLTTHIVECFIGVVKVHGAKMSQEIRKTDSITSEHTDTLQQLIQTFRAKLNHESVA